jgi:glucose/arabinose dehydrogenase
LLRVALTSPRALWYDMAVRDLRGIVRTLVSASAALGFAVDSARAVCGDLNDTANVTSTDALLCLQGAVGAIDLDGRCEPETGCNVGDRPCGDVNKDDSNNASDCLLILNASVQLVDLATSCDCDGPVDVCAGIEPVSGTDITTVRVAQGLPYALYVAAPPLDFRRLVVVLQSGIVRLVKDGSLETTPFLDIRDRVQFIDCLCGEEQGLLGLAFHPDYASNGYVFVNYSQLGSGDTVISRFTRLPNGDALDAASEQVLFTVPQIDPYHNGGGIQFGPDGYLWIGMGDGNGDPGGDPAGTAQDDANPLGKLLRVDVDVESSPFWAAPPDNPNPGAPGLRRLIWSKGLRNPWRFSFDRETGDLLIGDVGQSEVEEIDFQPASSTGGENYGWNVFEGTSCFDSPCPNPSAFTPPIHEYGHPPNVGGSVTGGYVYRGCALPDLHGTYFYADWAAGFIRSFEIANDNAVNHLDRTTELQPADGSGTGSVSSFGEDARGEIYLTDYFQGDVFKIVPQ